MRNVEWRLTIGANVESGGVRFRVWAPTMKRADVVLCRNGLEGVHGLTATGDGYYEAFVPGTGSGARYRYRLDGVDYPDPASRSQPDGVHGASEVVAPDDFRWTDDAWAGTAIGDLVAYELHVGAFTPEGTFEAAIEQLDALVELGVTAVEVMPIASFSGSRNWGYDGVMLYAPTAAYGGPVAFKRFVDAAHRRGLGVILDVVYNHFGPEGNYLPAITGGHFFTSRRETPWGDAINYDGPQCDAVRDFVLQNALYWAHEYHVDGLRLDATHAIVDNSPIHLLRQLADRLHSLERPRLVIAEDNRNERRLVVGPEQGGFGLDAVWSDDFHHQVRRLVAGDNEGHFSSFSGSALDLAATLRKGWFHEGQPSTHSDRGRGTSADGISPSAFVHCIQNHDQVGNRALGDRLNHAVTLPVYRAVSALLLLSRYTPLIWMGQEWAASSPFLYFTDHPEPLGRLVSEGRREEFKAFASFADPEARERIPDPQAEATFSKSKLRWEERDREPHRGVLALYRALLAIRRDASALRDSNRGFEVVALGPVSLALRRRSSSGDDFLAVINLGESLRVSLNDLAETRALDGQKWSLMLSTEEERFGGDGNWGGLRGDGVLDLAGPGAVVMTHAR